MSAVRKSKRGLYVALCIGGDVLREIKDEATKSTIISKLGGVEGMRNIMMHGDQRVKDQLRGFVGDIWADLTEEDISEMVEEMRKSDNGHYAEYIPAEWRPKSTEEYIEMVTAPWSYNYAQ